MNRIAIIITLCALFISQAAFAQSKRKKVANDEPQLSAEQLIQNYQFDKAARQLQRDIAAARKAGRATDRLEADLHRANLAADMLSGTEKVMFVDSIVMPRDRVLATLHLAKRSGRLLPTAEVANNFAETPADMGETAYINELADRIYFSAATAEGAPRSLFTAYAMGDSWTAPQPLEGIEADGEQHDDYPFVMPDGMTIYYASEGPESIGGYDIFITRYDTNNKRYVKAENVGMPFNSPANDYLMGIDETSGLGWFVTDRNQPTDSVCLYVFVQNDSRDIYELTDDNAAEVTRFAKINSIADTQTDAQALQAARNALAEAEKNIGAESSMKRRYVINDRTVYTSLSEFRSDAARRIAQQLDEVGDQLQALTQQHDDLQRQAAAGNRSRDVLNKLQQLEKSIPQMRLQLSELAKNMRKAELQ